MTERAWEAPIIELGPDACCWVVWLMVRDLAEWGPERRSRLTKMEATALCMYLADHLAPEVRERLEVPPVRPVLKAS